MSAPSEQADPLAINPLGASLPRVLTGLPSARPERGGAGVPDIRRLPEAIRTQQTRLLGEIIDESIARSREARAERAEREQRRARLAEAEARRTEREAQAAEADQRRSEEARRLAEADARRAQRLGVIIDVYG